MGERKKSSTTQESSKSSCPAISKKMFLEIIRAVRREEEKNERMTDMASEVFDGHFVARENPSMSMLFLLLKELIDPYEYVLWWLYEDVEKKVWFNSETDKKVEIDLTTPEQLYDFLKEEWENREK